MVLTRDSQPLVIHGVHLHRQKHRLRIPEAWEEVNPVVPVPPREMSLPTQITRGLSTSFPKGRGGMENSSDSTHVDSE